MFDWSRLVQSSSFVMTQRRELIGLDKQISNSGREGEQTSKEGKLGKPAKKREKRIDEHFFRLDLAVVSNSPVDVMTRFQ